MCVICHVLTVFIAEILFVITYSSRNDLTIHLIPKVHPSNKTNEDITYNDTKNDSNVKKILREKSEDDDINDFGDDRIVGGIHTDINLYPYHVGFGTGCGGAILDTFWVITSAHCGNRHSYITYGSKYFDKGIKVIVKDYFLHPKWNTIFLKHPFDYDFQLLQLATPIRLGINAKPIKLANSEDFVVGKMVTVTGWGRIREFGPFSNVLRAVRVPIVSKNSCQHIDLPHFRGKLTKRMFCAGYYEGKKDACEGDSGGPAVTSNGKLLGIVSFGHGCARAGAYGVYSKVGLVKGWMKNITGLNIT